MFEPHGRTYPFEDESRIDPSILETFPYAEPGKDLEIVIETEEFTVVCPYSGLPDFGKVTIVYVPDKDCIELRSLKYYLLSFRNVGIFQEHVTRRMLNDLVAVCKPNRMTVTVDYNIRGGIHTTCKAEYRREES
ncbi:MAG: NADPH-dependent 7-cyano-7-deazaguanine reductase QueF [Candidatus Latescibacteria bacterium]|nr:NADPH-dependent 7-cyano-7-deazaguanine reductase QueF [Candidatus Latescibacterota bacterium]